MLRHVQDAIMFQIENVTCVSMDPTQYEYKLLSLLYKSIHAPYMSNTQKNHHVASKIGLPNFLGLN